MSEINPELYARMERLVRRLNTSECLQSEEMSCIFADDIAEVRSIIASLPEPIDPDLIEAREMMVAEYRSEQDKQAIREGKCDNWHRVALRLEGIKRGRALQAGEAK